MVAYKRRTERLRWDDLDLGRFAVDRLESGALTCVRFMHDVEFHTVCYLRDLLVSPARSGPGLSMLEGSIRSFGADHQGPAFSLAA